MTDAVRRFSIKFAELIRTCWAIIGITLLMLVLMESCFRVRSAVKSSRREGRPAQLLAGDPRAASWFDDFSKDYDATRAQRWKSYLYFGRVPSYSGKYVSIDSLGRRVTPQPQTPAEPVARVYFFGGSTMWGTSLRGDHTIPAEASHRLQDLAGPGSRVEVVNFGETGYVSTQEIIQLMLELRAGKRPDVVVFYDGLNDVAATAQWGAPGIPQNESKRVSEFAMGRALDRTSFGQGIGKDLHAFGILAGEGIAHLELFNWVLSLKPSPEPTFPTADSVARGTVHVYAENVKLVEALARQYGFTPIYVWQPNLHASEKKLNPFEERLRRAIGNDALHKRLQQTHRILPPILDSTMAGVAPGRFIDAAALFRGDTLAAYTDWLGHNTEGAIPPIVDSFWPALERATRDVIARRRGVASAAPAVVSPRTN
jgi:hypothetical protein